MSSSSKDAFKHVIDSIYAAINDGNIENARQIFQETKHLKAISKHERFGATLEEVAFQMAERMLWSWKNE